MQFLILASLGIVLNRSTNLINFPKTTSPDKISNWTFFWSRNTTAIFEHLFYSFDDAYWCPKIDWNKDRNRKLEIKRDLRDSEKNEKQKFHRRHF